MNPDKRVPRRLFDYLYEQVTGDGDDWAADELRACPDIVDEPSFQVEQLESLLESYKQTNATLRDVVEKRELMHMELESRLQAARQPATLDPTAQAVLEASVRWRDGGITKKEATDTIGGLERAVAAWHAAGRPTVVQESERREQAAKEGAGG